MNVLVKDGNGNTLYRSNDPGTLSAEARDRWAALTGYSIEADCVTFTADYVVVTLYLQDGEVS